MAKNEINSLLNEFALRNFAYGEYYSLMKWLPNPDLILNKANKTIKIYEELLSDPFVSGCQSSRKAGVLSLEWDIDRKQSKNPQFQFIKTIFNNLPIYKIINSILDATAYGYSVLEIIWEQNNNYYIPIDIKQKPAEWFLFSPDGQLLFKTKQNSAGEPVPRNKFIVATNEGSYANPYGKSILSKCFWPTMFKKGGLKFWVTFTEKFGNPWTLIKVPINFSQTQIDEIVEVFDKMIQDGIAVYKENIDTKLIFPNTSSIEVFEKMIQYCKDDISMAFLGHTKAGQSVPGELGNRTNQIEVRNDIILADKRLVEETFNNLIKIIYSLNLNSITEIPTFVLYEEQDSVDRNLAERDKILNELGISFTREYIKKAYYLNDTDFELKSSIESTTQNLPKTTQQINLKTTPEFAAKTNGQDLIDSVLEKLTQKYNSLSNNIYKPIINFLKEANSLESALEKLAELFPTFNIDELYDILVKMQFAAYLLGKLEIKNELKS